MQVMTGAHGGQRQDLRERRQGQPKRRRKTTDDQTFQDHPRSCPQLTRGAREAVLDERRHYVSGTDDADVEFKEST